MRYCAVCKKRFAGGTLFSVPKDPVERAKWGEICGRNFARSNEICADHFSEASIVRAGKKVRLLTNAEPLAKVAIVNESKNDYFTLEQLATSSPSHQLQTDKEVQTEVSSGNKRVNSGNLQNVHNENVTTTKSSLLNDSMVLSESLFPLEQLTTPVQQKPYNENSYTHYCVMGCPTENLYRFPSRETDVERRKIWLDYFNMEEPYINDVFSCEEHFSNLQATKNGIKLDAVPDLPIKFYMLMPPFRSKSSNPRKDFVAPSSYDEEDVKGVFTQNSFNIKNNVQSPKLQKDVIFQVPIIKSVSCAVSTQTNTRLCGTVQVSELADEFRFNCFYCSAIFPIGKWKKFTTHVKKKHDFEEAFKISKYVSDDHDYTPIDVPQFTPAEPVVQEPAVETIIVNAKSLIPFLEDPLEQKSISSVVFNPNFNITPEEITVKTEFLPATDPIYFGATNEFNNSENVAENEYSIKNVKHKLSKKILKKDTTKNKSKVISSGILYFNKNTKRQNSKVSALSRCLKRQTFKVEDDFQPMPVESVLQITTEQNPEVSALSRCLKRQNREVLADLQTFPVESVLQITEEPNPEVSPLSPEPQNFVVDEDLPPLPVKTVPQRSTELCFEYTPPKILNLLLDNMKNYPVLWQFDKEPFNEDFYEAVEELTKMINEKWSLNIDNLKMRRSINRILRFYCYLFPNDKMENINEYTNYYDKCAAFLPASVNDIAYARCSHCYKCYTNDSDLKRHLLEEFKYLQWPFKCVECKECFRENDEYEFHKRLSHYDEIFRCEECNLTYFHRNKYNRHMVTRHGQAVARKFICNICDNSYDTCGQLATHKKYHGEKKYKCPMCPKSYYGNSHLMHHLKRHRKEFNIICEVCGKGFVLVTQLKNHMATHTGAKVTCNICNLRLRKSSLGRHLRLVHIASEGTIETTYRARTYHYNRFTRQRKKIGSRKGKQRNYYCKVCKVNFDCLKEILEHNKELHPKETIINKLPCQMCTTELTNKVNLRRHYRKVHKFNMLQVFKLVDENEDLNDVLRLGTEDIDTNVENLDSSQDDTKSNDKTIAPVTKLTTIIKSDPSPDEVYFEAEKMHSSTIQDEIMEAVDNIEIQENKIDYMNDFFTELLKN